MLRRDTADAVNEMSAARVIDAGDRERVLTFGSNADMRALVSSNLRQSGRCRRHGMQRSHPCSRLAT